MGDLYSVINPLEIVRYVDTDKLDAEMCLHLIEDSFYKIDRLNAYHFGKLKKAEYKLHFRGDEDLHQMWGNVQSAIIRIKLLDPTLIAKVPKAFLPSGRFYKHPSTWTKEDLKRK